MILALFRIFSRTASSSFPAVAALPTLLVRKRVPATVVAGSFSATRVAANKTTFSFRGKITLVAPFGISIPNLNI